VDGPGRIGGDHWVGVVEESGDIRVPPFPEGKGGAGANENGVVFRKRNEGIGRCGPGKGDGSGVAEIGQADVVLLAGKEFQDWLARSSVAEPPEPEEGLNANALRRILKPGKQLAC